MPTANVDPRADTADLVNASERSDGVARDRLGRYLVIGRLGSGGMGVVYEAFDPELDRRVAIKLLRPGTADANHRLRLLREAQAMARLSHPHVVQVHDVGVVDGDVFVAMELVQGETLAAWMRSSLRRWPDVVSVFLDAGRGLTAAHAVGIVHRDFKPDNVLLDRGGRARVVDFGVASCGQTDGGRATPERLDSGPVLTRCLTAHGAIATHLTAKTNTAYHKMGHLIGAAKRWDISAAYCAHTSNTSNSTNKHSLSQDGASDRSRQEMGHLSSILCSHKQHI